MWSIYCANDASARILVTAPLRNKSALATLVEHLFLPYRACGNLVSDQGLEFGNELLAKVTKLLGIDKLRTTAYRTSANGRIERVHRSVNILFSRIISYDQKIGRTNCRLSRLHITQPDTTSLVYSPFYLLHCHEYRTPIDLILPIPNENLGSEADYVQKLRDSLQNALQW